MHVFLLETKHQIHLSPVSTRHLWKQRNRWSEDDLSVEGKERLETGAVGPGAWGRKVFVLKMALRKW